MYHSVIFSICKRNVEEKSTSWAIVNVETYFTLFYSRINCGNARNRLLVLFKRLVRRPHLDVLHC